MRLHIAAVCVLLLLVSASSASNKPKRATLASARLESLKQLAGDWVAIGKDGKPTGDVVTSIKVTAAGTVVQETLFPGTEHEMITMYHLDGEDLVLTHYCAAGNQPRMKAEPGTAGGPIAFKFSGGTGIVKGATYMDHATVTIRSKDRYQAEWVACKEGKECHKANFDVVRKR